jgi:hypothetical protein
MPPAGPGTVLVVRVEHAVPALAVGGAVRHAGELVPAAVVIIVVAVEPGRPDHLRQSVGEQPELRLVAVLPRTCPRRHGGCRVGGACLIETLAQDRDLVVAVRQEGF